jgi:argininosuccinate synthase
MTQDPLKAPDTPTDITLSFEKGIPVKLVTPEKSFTEPVELFQELNRIGYIHAIGRIDIVENRFIGLKSRGCYDCNSVLISYLLVSKLTVSSAGHDNPTCSTSGSRRCVQNSCSSPYSRVIHMLIRFS